MRLIGTIAVLFFLSPPEVVAQQPQSYKLGLVCSSVDQEYPLGHWVCNDAEAAQLSKQLNAAYHAAQMKTDQAGRDQLQQANAAWLSEIDQRCEQDRSKSCVTNALKARLKEFGIATPSTTPVAENVPPTTNRVDVFAFCRAATTLDTPQSVLLDATSEVALAAASTTNTYVWRCMDGEVWACGSGASGSACQTMSSSMTPSKAIFAFCARTPNADFVPMSVIGNSPASCKCVGFRPQVLQAMQLDKRHFMTDSWIRVEQSTPASSK
ncbi:lysozyme inhibitor LprI family protein [Bradyrhizobium sp. B097]|uniref:lysozyme inhibitor LprI family protein n=1 Tax=Bradyrhizobium sp. B097 TaxID=3140244 RepID=UPI003182E37F